MIIKSRLNCLLFFKLACRTPCRKAKLRLSTQSYCEAQILLKPCFEPFSSFPFCDNALLVKRAAMCCGRRLRRFLKRIFSAEKLSGEINSVC